MNGDPNDAVSIRIDIRVPCGPGRAPEISVGGGEPPSPMRLAGHTFEAAGGGLSILGFPGGAANVKKTGSASGVICVVDTAPSQNGRYPDQVQAAIYSLGAAIPPTPSGSVPDTYDQTTGNYRYNSLGTACCGTAASPCGNQLVTWYIWNTPSQTICKVSPFYGICAAVTDCGN